MLYSKSYELSHLDASLVLVFLGHDIELLEHELRSVVEPGEPLTALKVGGAHPEGARPVERLQDVDHVPLLRRRRQLGQLPVQVQALVLRLRPRQRLVADQEPVVRSISVTD